MNYYFLSFLLCTAILQANSSNAQSRQISGKVTDTRNEPLERASVQIKGKNLYAFTNKAGIYTITINTPLDTTLVFSSVGYSPKEVGLRASGTVYNVQLQDSIPGLNDLVVIGYGTSQRKDLTGSIGSVSMTDLSKAPVRSFDEALAGRVAGVQVNASDGQPGSPPSIIIRGNNSVTQDNSPLYVIDGVPLLNADNNVINPAEIENIEILKDASATAIYGSRGANGVIIITTKKGKIGASQVSYSNFIGFQQNIKKQKMLNPYEFVKYQLDLSPTLFTPVYLSNGYTLDSYKNQAGTDWQDETFRTAPMQNHTISISGGTEKTKYSVSGSLLNQDGIFINSGFRRYQGRIVLDQTINSHFKTGVNINYAALKTYGQVANQSDNTSVTAYLLYSIWGYRPVTGNPDKDAALKDQLLDPDVNATGDFRINPIISAKNTYNPTLTDILYANAYAEYKFFNNFSFRVMGGIAKSSARKEIFNSSNSPAGNSSTQYGALNGVNGSETNSETNTWLNENTLSYNKLFSRFHLINAVAGFTLQQTSLNTNGFFANQVPNEGLGNSGLDEGTPVSLTSMQSYNALESFLGRINYRYKSKYFLTVSFRADGSSKFSPENKWGYFPSGSMAWRISEEPFLKPLKSISDAKLRLSYGVTGNNRVTDFAYLPTLRINVTSNSGNTTSGYSFNNSAMQGAIPVDLGNANLKWETTEQTDLGLDLGLFKNRITFTADYYYKKTYNLLLNASLASSTGYLTAFKNIGQVSNKGLELTLNTINIASKGFSWSSNFNISFNRNKVLQLTENQASLTTRVNWNANFNNSLPYIAVPGKPIALLYGFVSDGVYQYSDFIQSSNGTYTLKDNVPNNGNARAVIQPGHVKYKDINGDGQVNSFDQTIIGNPNPKFIGGLSNNFGYKGFDLNVFFQWSYGNNMLNANRIEFEGQESRYLLNLFESTKDRWSPTNQGSDLFIANGGGPMVYSSRVIEDGSYLRLKTVALGYTLNKPLLQKLRISTIRIYASAQNVATWTKYSGLNPDVSVRPSALTPGFDWSAYPLARTITFGLNVTF